MARTECSGRHWWQEVASADWKLQLIPAHIGSDQSSPLSLRCSYQTQNIFTMHVRRHLLICSPSFVALQILVVNRQNDD
jgi:hypothetical protein